MKISKSKQELARIISENGGWRDGANYASQHGCHGGIGFSLAKPERCGDTGWDAGGSFIAKIEYKKPIKNWHQAILSRAEYFHLYPAQDADGWIEWNGGECPVGDDELVRVKVRGESGVARGEAGRWSWGRSGCSSDIIAYRLHKPEQARPEFCESVMRSIPEPKYKPSIEQLMEIYADRSHSLQLAKEHLETCSKQASEAMGALSVACKAAGFDISPITAKQELELVITDWRELQVGDEVEITGSMSGNRIGMVGVVSRFDEVDKGREVRVSFNGEESDYEWLTGWKFIRRP